MSISTVSVPAMLQADGLTLRLEERLPLPPGRVSVTIKPAEIAAGPTMLEVLDRIHREQRKRGHKPMTEEETASMGELTRDDDACEERWREIWSQVRTAKKVEN